METARREAELREAAKQQRELEMQEIEARILRAIPTPQAPPSNGGSRGHESSGDGFSAKVCKLLEALLDDEVVMEGVSRTDVEARVNTLSSSTVKGILEVRLNGEAVPRDKPARVSKLVQALRAQCRM